VQKIHDAITAEAKAIGLKPETALSALENKAFVGAVRGVDDVYVHAGGGAVASIRDAVAELVPIEVRNQTAHDRATYNHVMSRRAGSAAPPVTTGKPKHTLGTTEFMAERAAARREGRPFH